jgi:hypothetical protein
LAAEKSYNNLDISVTEALEYRRNRFEGVATCTKDESLGSIMERIVNKEVHRLVIVDSEMRVKGIISLSDILTYIVLKQDEQSTKTATLTQAFGLTRLSSNTDQILVNEPAASAVTSNGNSNLLPESAMSASNSRNVSPQATRTTNQPSSQLTNSSYMDAAIFEDDPMET